MKILVPADGSKASEHAVSELIKYIMRLREKPQLELLFVHLPIRPAPTTQGVSIDLDILDKYYKGEASDATAKAHELFKAAQLSFSENSSVGDPSEEICRAAQEKGCDMIWMGTRGMGAFSNFLLGSVATKVLHRARIPVVLAPVPHEEEERRQ